MQSSRQLMEGLMKMRRKSSTLVVAAAAAALIGAFGMNASSANAQSGPVFDWSVTGAGNPNTPGGSTTAAGYTPAPFLTDASAMDVRNYLASQPAGSVLAVKVNGPISASTANIVFGTAMAGGMAPPSYKISYVFADFESTSSSADITETQQLIAQIRGAGSTSASAYIGEFNLSPTPSDSTRPPGAPAATSPAPNGNTASSFQSVFGSHDYNTAGANMANESAYPGSGDFLDKAQAGSPDIRSALFILPIDRVTYASVSGSGNNYGTSAGVFGGPVITPNGYQNIPWVARFNNWGNNALNNVPGYNGYKFA
ncbi:MAG TPA: hypothetical protein VFE47_08865, partial [Tepidisphaeraceae bacterium]|nr:hypothetical protein [Tepidisphaeraceae bacterium]